MKKIEDPRVFAISLELATLVSKEEFEIATATACKLFQSTLLALFNPQPPYSKIINSWPQNWQGDTVQDHKMQ
jgi:hypothetical protein